MSCEIPIYRSFLGEICTPLETFPHISFSDDNLLSDHRIQDAISRQIINLNLVNHFIEMNSNIQIRNGLSDSDRIRECQQQIEQIEKVKEVVAVILPIKLTDSQTETRESGTCTKLCLFHEKLSIEIQHSLQQQLQIPSHLMKGVRDICHIAFGEGKFYSFHFLSEYREERSKIHTVQGENETIPFIWNINSDQIKALQKLRLTKDSVLTKLGDLPLLCSTFRASEAKMDFLNETLNQAFIVSPVLRHERK